MSRSGVAAAIVEDDDHARRCVGLVRNVQIHPGPAALAP